MGGPGGLIGEDPLRMFGQAGDHRPGKRALAHVGHRLGIDDVIAMAGAQESEEIAAALRLRGAKPGEVGVADLGAHAVAGFVASAGVVHRDPGRARKPGAEHIAGLVEESVLAGDQQAHDLPLGDDDAERPQQRQQPRHRDLPLMVLGEHEAAQLRPEMTMNAGRQRRRHHFTVRPLPALAAEIHDLRADHQVLHHKIRVAFKACAVRWGGDFDGALLVDRKLRRFAALRARLARRRRLRLGRLVHATGFDIRPA